MLSLSCRQMFGEGLTWAGCVLVTVLGQQRRFLMLDFCSHLLNVHQVDMKLLKGDDVVKGIVSVVVDPPFVAPCGQLEWYLACPPLNAISCRCYASLGLIPRTSSHRFHLTAFLLITLFIQHFTLTLHASQRSSSLLFSYNIPLSLSMLHNAPHYSFHTTFLSHSLCFTAFLLITLSIQHSSLTPYFTALLLITLSIQHSSLTLYASQRSSSLLFPYNIPLLLHTSQRSSSLLFPYNIPLSLSMLHSVPPHYSFHTTFLSHSLCFTAFLLITLFIQHSSLTLHASQRSSSLLFPYNIPLSLSMLHSVPPHYSFHTTFLSHSILHSAPPHYSFHTTFLSHSLCFTAFLLITLSIQHSSLTPYFTALLLITLSIQHSSLTLYASQRSSSLLFPYNIPLSLSMLHSVPPHYSFHTTFHSHSLCFTTLLITLFIQHSSLTLYASQRSSLLFSYNIPLSLSMLHNAPHYSFHTTFLSHSPYFTALLLITLSIQHSSLTLYASQRSSSLLFPYNIPLSLHTSQRSSSLLFPYNIPLSLSMLHSVPPHYSFHTTFLSHSILHSAPPHYSFHTTFLSHSLCFTAFLLITLSIQHSSLTPYFTALLLITLSIQHSSLTLYASQRSSSLLFPYNIPLSLHTSQRSSSLLFPYNIPLSLSMLHSVPPHYSFHTTFLSHSLCFTAFLLITLFIQHSTLTLYASQRSSLLFSYNIPLSLSMLHNAPHYSFHTTFLSHSLCFTTLLITLFIQHSSLTLYASQRSSLLFSYNIPLSLSILHSAPPHYSFHTTFLSHSPCFTALLLITLSIQHSSLTPYFTALLLIAISMRHSSLTLHTYVHPLSPSVPLFLLFPYHAYHWPHN